VTRAIDVLIQRLDKMATSPALTPAGRAFVSRRLAHRRRQAVTGHGDPVTLDDAPDDASYPPLGPM